MSMSVIAAVVWVFAATGVAMLPMRRQFPPGIILLIAAPMIIVWLGFDFGLIAAAGGFAAFISMFRNPIRFYWNKWRGSDRDQKTGQSPEHPPVQTPVQSPEDHS